MILNASETKVRDVWRIGGGVTCFPFPVDTVCHQQASTVAILCAMRQRHHIVALIIQIKVTTESFNIFASEKYVIIMNPVSQQE